jgi:nicotinamidase-related amidase
MRPAYQDLQKVAVVLIDAQYDFVHPDGQLPVPGALEDSVRFLEWFYANVHQITTVVTTLDTHVPLQIFFASWWHAPQDNKYAPEIHPAPYTPITVQDLEQGRWEPTIEAKWSQEYVRKLQKMGKKDLMIWPYHCLEGTQGHLLLPPIAEAIVYHRGLCQS